MKTPYKPEVKEDYKLIRILTKDIRGNKKIYVGLKSIKGISWSFSNALCKKMAIDKNKKIEELSKEEIAKIEDFINNPDLPGFLKNRRKDVDSGEDRHLNSADLDLQKEFDIKKMKKMRSYKGVRHMLGQPVRGQRTKSHFRKNKKKSGVGLKKTGEKK